MNNLLEKFIVDNYNYEIDEEDYGTFSRKDNPRCLINFSLEFGEEYDRLKIELFQCFPPIGSASVGVPRSNGTGRTMMLYFLMYIKTQFSNIRTVFLEPQAYPDEENMTEEQYQIYHDNLPLYQRTLEQYYNSLGFKIDEDGWFEGYIDHIIRSIKNYDIMKSFNANINPQIEREMLEYFGIDITTPIINRDKPSAQKSSSRIVSKVTSKRGGKRKTIKKKSIKKKTIKKRRK